MHVARDQVAMGYHVAARAAGQRAKVHPEAAQRRDVEQRLAAPEAGVHPVVVIGQVTATTLTLEGSAAGVDAAYVLDELGEGTVPS